MGFEDDLRQRLEREEAETVGDAFGGHVPAARKNYSVVTIRNWIIATTAPPATPLTIAIDRARSALPGPLFKAVVENLVRYAFLIELTNLKIGSTKMKTRWVPGLIKMPQEGSFEPINGTFQPGNDVRASSFDDCAAIFATACNLVCDQIAGDGTVADLLSRLRRFSRVPYEFPLGYRNIALPQLHRADNVNWVLNDDFRWLLRAREILATTQSEHTAAVREIIKSKLEVKVFKTDRSLTGRDKTNRAKRWEVRPDDFQHATLEQCWSAERRLTADLIGFDGFPITIREHFENTQLIAGGQPLTRCPVTLEPLNFATLSAAVLTATHGVSDYQVGHLHPLKRGGRHDGDNVRWQSADGNRIQGDLTIEETNDLLNQIAVRRVAAAATPPTAGTSPQQRTPPSGQAPAPPPAPRSPS